MTDKERVLLVYPRAVLLRNRNHWAEPSNLILVDEVPQRLLQQLQSGIIDADKWVSWPPKMRALSNWVVSEEESWKDAWIQIQRKMLEVLEDA